MVQKKKKTKEELEAEARARAEAKGLTFVPEAEAKARAEESARQRAGGGILTTKDQPSGIELPDDRTFLGLSPDEVREIQQRKGLGLPLISERAEQERKKGEAIPILEEAGAFEEVTPREVELSPELKTDIPFLTPTLGAASQVAKPRSVLGIARDKGWFPKLLPEIKTGEEAFPTPETPEMLREAALRQISIDRFNKGTTEAEKWGAFMETLPGFSFIDQWVQGVVEAPYGNTKDVLAEIEKIATTATNNQEKTRSGIMPPAFALDRVRIMEERIAELEGRLKSLINESKILQANTDEVNVMMQKILDAKIRTDNFRTTASFAYTAELTGTGRIIPTDEQLYFELKEGKK